MREIVRTQAWRALADALGLAGSINVGHIQIEPAQPVVDLWDLTRWNAQRGHVAGVDDTDDGVIRLARDFTMTGGGGQPAVFIDLFALENGPRGTELRFWIDAISVQLQPASTLADFEALTVECFGRQPVPNATSSTDTGTAQLVFAATVDDAIESPQTAPNALLVNRLGTPPRPIQVAHPGPITIRSRQIAAPAGDIDVLVGVVGRFLPLGIQAR